MLQSPPFLRNAALLALVLINLLIPTSCVVGAEPTPLKVFVLAGQSNMQGHANVKTLADLATSPDTHPLLDQLFDSNGKPQAIDDVWITYLSKGGEKHGKLSPGFGANDQKIGPELTFGLRMREHCDGPILIIKTAWGGKSLNTDFRPPSSGPYEFDDEQLKRLKDRGKDPKEVKEEKAAATGHYYRLMIGHVQSVLSDIEKVYPDYDSNAGYELAGFVWFQGWNDMVDRCGPSPKTNPCT